jgi:hypothetical protein
MATETLSTEHPAIEITQSVSARDLLLHHLKHKGYKLMKDDAMIIPEKKEGVLAAVRHGKKELIDVKALSDFYPVAEIREEHTGITDQLLHSIQSVAEALFFSFIHFGRYFKGEKMTLALALPDTQRYRQILEKLEDYFTENNLDFKVYLVALSGDVQERNLNGKMNKAEMSKEVMEQRKALKL